MNDISVAISEILDRLRSAEDSAIRLQNSVDVLREELEEALGFLGRAKGCIEEASACWNKPDKPGLWPSRASVLIDQITAYRNRTASAE